MVLSADQERIKSLLAETVTLLCKKVLRFNSELTIEGLIGITLDHQDIFLVGIKETYVGQGQGTSDATTGIESENVSASNEMEKVVIGNIRKRLRSVDDCVQPSADVYEANICRPPLLFGSGVTTENNDIASGRTAVSEFGKFNNIRSDQSCVWISSDHCERTAIVGLPSQNVGARSKPDMFGDHTAGAVGRLSHTRDTRTDGNMCSGSIAGPLHSNVLINRLSEPCREDGNVIQIKEEASGENNLSHEDNYVQNVEHSAVVNLSINNSCELSEKNYHICGDDQKPRTVESSTDMYWSSNRPTIINPSDRCSTNTCEATNCAPSELKQDLEDYEYDSGSVTSIRVLDSDTSLLLQNSGNLDPSCSLMPRGNAIGMSVSLRSFNVNGRYVCPYCQRHFAASNNLRGHLVIHTGVREFQCPLCAQEFAYKHHLKAHLGKCAYVASMT